MHNKRIDDGRGDSPQLRTIDSPPRPSHMTLNKMTKNTDNNSRVLEFVHRMTSAHHDEIKNFMFVFSSRSSERENFIQYGSGFGISCNGLQYIVTAFHVVKDYTKNNLLITHKSGTSYQIKDLSSFHVIKNEELDYFAIEMPMFTEFGKYYKIQRDQIDVSFDDFEFAVVSGFPNSKNKRRIRSSAQNTLTMLQHVAQIKSISDHFLFLTHDGDKAFDENLEEIDAIGLRGVSGGAIFAITKIKTTVDFINHCVAGLEKEQSTGVKFVIDSDINLIGILIEAKIGEYIKCVRSKSFLSAIFEDSLKRVK